MRISAINITSKSHLQKFPAHKQRRYVTCGLKFLLKNLILFGISDRAEEGFDCSKSDYASVVFVYSKVTIKSDTKEDNSSVPMYILTIELESQTTLIEYFEKFELD